MKSHEVDLLWRFKKSEELSGWFIREVPVGLSIRGEHTMRIDAIYVEGSPPFELISKLDIILEAWDAIVWIYNFRPKLRGRSVWILEVKRELNAEALG